MSPSPSRSDPRPRLRRHPARLPGAESALLGRPQARRDPRRDECQPRLRPAGPGRRRGDRRRSLRLVAAVHHLPGTLSRQPIATLAINTADDVAHAFYVDDSTHDLFRATHADEGSWTGHIPQRLSYSHLYR